MALIPVRADHVNPVDSPSPPACLQWIDSPKTASTLKSLEGSNLPHVDPQSSVQSLTESGQGST